MPDYRVNLEIYNGPLDLLLYLIRREEVDIYDIPIARITEQYVEHVEVLKGLDPNIAGEFLVLAATLMEIKTRMLLPRPAPEEGEGEGVEIDPRTELVRQLLEYKAFKDAADDLRSARDAQSQKFPRAIRSAGDAGEVDLEEAQVWDLLDAFSRLLSAIGADADTHEVIYDDTPIELHATDVMHRLRTEGAMTFTRIFEGRSGRSEIVGLFLALLELIRRGRILAAQSANFDDIHISINPDPPEQEDAEAVREGPEEGVYAPTSQAQSGTTTEAEGIEQRQSVGEGQGDQEGPAEIEQTGGDFPQTAQGSAEQHDEDDENHRPGREDPRTGD